MRADNFTDVGLATRAGYVESQTNSTYYDKGGSDLPEAVVIAAIVMCAVFMLVGITGNLMTVVALSLCRKLHNATTALVINLAVADLIFCACVMPTRAAMLADQRSFSCGVFLFFFYGNVTASLATMMAIAANRYLLVLHSDLYYRVFTFFGTTLTIAFIWLYSFAVWTVPVVGTWGHFAQLHNTSAFCQLKEEEGSPKLFLAFFGFIFPLIVITVAYSAIFGKVWLNQKQAAELNLANGSRRQLRHIQFTKVLLIAYCSFLFFWAPNFAILMIPEVRRNSVALTVGESLFWISSCTNPFVYVLCSKYYRQAYYSLFKPSLRATMAMMDCSRRPASLPKIMHDGHSGVIHSTHSLPSQSR